MPITEKLYLRNDVIRKLTKNNEKICMKRNDKVDVIVMYKAVRMYLNDVANTQICICIYK